MKLEDDIKMLERRDEMDTQREKGLEDFKEITGNNVKYEFKEEAEIIIEEK